MTKEPITIRQALLKWIIETKQLSLKQKSHLIKKVLLGKGVKIIDNNRNDSKNS